MVAISRRSFLLSGVAAIAVPVLSPVAVPLAAARSAPATKIWICGTPGEYDWHPFDAPTREAAWRQFCHYRGRDEAAPIDDQCIDRAVGFDGQFPEDIRGADWIANGFGACCDRCGYETHDGAGGRVIADEVVCEDCLTYSERVEIDRDGVLNDLICEISDDGADAVQRRMILRGEWGDMPPALWAEAVAVSDAESGAT